MKTVLKITLAAIVGAFVTDQALSAPSIGVNFVGRDDANTWLASGESAGVEALQNWQNVATEDPFDGTSPALRSSDGTYTAVKLSWQANDAWKSDGPTVTSNDRLMKGILKANPDPDLAPANGTEKMTFTFQDVPAGAYDVIVYGAHNGSPARVNINLGATTYYVDQTASFDGTFAQGTSTSSATYTAGDYVRFAGVSPAGNGTIVITATKKIENDGANPPAQLTDGIGVAAIQLVKNSGTWNQEAPTAAPTITGQPTATPELAVAGQSVTLRVRTDGPWDVQWLKDGAEVSGATSGAYTFTATAADTGNWTARITNPAGQVVSDGILLEVDADTGPVLTQGIVPMKHYAGITGTQVLDNLYPNAAYPDSPTSILANAGVDVAQTNPDLNDFGRVLEFVLRPPTSGNLRFFVRSDDSSEVHISDNATIPDLAGLVNEFPAAAEGGCCGPFEEPGQGQNTAPGYELVWPTSEEIAVVAGQDRGMVLVYKEGGGGDFVQLAMRYSTDTTPAASLQPIPPEYVWGLVNPAGHRAEITSQPRNVSAQETRRASFSVAVSTRPAGDPTAVQWLKNGAIIPGATALDYTTAPLDLADDGAKIQAKIYTLTGTILSSEATLTVLPDTFPPVPSAGAIVSSDGTSVDIGVGFDEAVDDATAGDLNNYAISIGTVNSFNYYPESGSVLANVSGLNPGDSAVITIQNVEDPKGNAITSVNVPVTVSESLTWGVVGAAELGVADNFVIPVDDNGFDVFSNGFTEWAAYDEATFVYEEVTGDFDKKLQVVYQDNSSQWARAGLIVREDLTVLGMDRTTAEGGGAGRYQKVHANPVGPTLTGPGTPGNNTYETNRRLTVGGQTDAPGSKTGVDYPNSWVRLQREGDVVRMYWGEDGLNWSQIAETTFDPVLPTTVYVGPEFSPENGNITNQAERGRWLAKFRNYGDTFAAGPPNLAVAVEENGDLTLTYDGTLEAADAINGAFVPVSGASSPYTVTPGTEGNQFFRAKQ